MSATVRLFLFRPASILMFWFCGSPSLQTHSEVAGFKCHQCGSKFKHKSSLSAHIKCHANSGLLPCPVIGCRRAERGFHLARSLRTHLHNHHQRFLCSNVRRVLCFILDVLKVTSELHGTWEKYTVLLC
jgi:hypothetical protein